MTSWHQDEQLRQVLERKAVLFDTDFLSDVVKNQEQFQEFLYLIADAHATPMITELVRGEFLGGVHDETLRDARDKFLKELKVDPLHLNPLDKHVDDAVDVINDLCRHKERDRLGLIDAIHIALLKKYKTNLVLVTRNLRDFPTSILRRDTVFAVDLGGRQEVYAYGLYSWRGRSAQ